MRLPEPFCQFCRHDDGTFDYGEFHAIECGIGDGILDARSWQIQEDRHYYILARAAATLLTLFILRRLAR